VTIVNAPQENQLSDKERISLTFQSTKFHGKSALFILIYFLLFFSSNSTSSKNDIKSNGSYTDIFFEIRTHKSNLENQIEFPYPLNPKFKFNIVRLSIPKYSEIFSGNNLSKINKVILDLSIFLRSDIFSILTNHTTHSKSEKSKSETICSYSPSIFSNNSPLFTKSTNLTISILT
jgi:hypothetical protein